MHVTWQAQVQETCSSEMLRGQGADFREGLHVGALDLQVS